VCGKLKTKKPNNERKKTRYPMEDWSLCSTRGPEAVP